MHFLHNSFKVECQPSRYQKVIRLRNSPRFFLGFGYAGCSGPGCSGQPDSFVSTRGLLYAHCLRLGTAGAIRGRSGRPGSFVSPRGAEDLRWNTLSEIGKPDSGTEPIHQEHVMCSRFRGSCPSDVKSAVHPEPGFPISLSVFAAALCAPREIQKNPAARSVPVYRPRFQPQAADIRSPQDEPVPVEQPHTFNNTCGQ